MNTWAEWTKRFAASGAGIGKKGNDKYAALQQRQNVIGFWPDGAGNSVKKGCDSLINRRMKRHGSSKSWQCLSFLQKKLP